MNRKHLVLLTWATACGGLLLASLPFAGSMRPNARAEAARPRVDISRLQAGSIALMDSPVRDDVGAGFRWSILMLRRSDGSVSAWEVPVKDERIGMPDVHWWRPHYACAHFGLAEVDGKLDEASHLTCRDSELPSDEWASHWRWSIDGKAVDDSVDDMEATQGFVEGNYFVFGEKR